MSHADSAAIFIQMIKTVKFTISWFLLHNICMIYHVKFFTKYVRRKSMCPINWWATGKVNPARFLETVISYEKFRRNFKKKQSSNICYCMISVRTFFCVCHLFNFSIRWQSLPAICFIGGTDCQCIKILTKD